MQKLKTHHARQLLELKAEGRLTSEMDSEVPCFCCDGKARRGEAWQGGQWSEHFGRSAASGVRLPGGGIIHVG